MDRFALFIDAGYLFAAASQLAFGEKKARADLALDHKQAVDSFVNLAQDNCGHHLLRAYWYDAARDARPTISQLEVANLPGVKLRLGRLVQSGQKGVDSRIVRDLIVLSQERAIQAAYLLGADEDLREGVAEAQERGVRVVLMAIEPLKQNLSPTLAMEADDIIALDKPSVEKYIALTSPPVLPVGTTGAVAGGVSEVTPVALGRAFGLEYREKHSPEAVSGLRRDRPRIPGALDKALLQSAANALKKPHLEDSEREDIRAGFWQAILTDDDGEGS